MFGLIWVILLWNHIIWFLCGFEMILFFCLLRRRQHFKKLGAKFMGNPVYYARIYLRRKLIWKEWCLLIYTRTRGFLGASLLGWHHQNILKEMIYQLWRGIGTLSSSHLLGLFEINIYVFCTLNYQGESDICSGKGFHSWQKFMIMDSGFYFELS